MTETVSFLFFVLSVAIVFLMLKINWTIADMFQLFSQDKSIQYNSGDNATETNMITEINTTALSF